MSEFDKWIDDLRIEVKCVQPSMDGNHQWSISFDGVGFPWIKGRLDPKHLETFLRHRVKEIVEDALDQGVRADL